MKRERSRSYLYTINRQVLDFDFEKYCSVSLTNLNVYACLVCGKYLQGRGRNTHAFMHSVEQDHHVFINLQNERVYCLPEGYEVEDRSLDDIRDVLRPKYSRESVAAGVLDQNTERTRALDGSFYLPGLVGLNSFEGTTDYINVVVLSLMRVAPLRDFFLVADNYRHAKSPLVHRFGELTRKIWHARNFKGHVCPHEFTQAVMATSHKRFCIRVRSSPVEFLQWLLNALHVGLGGSKTHKRSIIYECFQGELEEVTSEHKNKRPFLRLGLDLPEHWMTEENCAIPHVPITVLLKKFDGEAAVPRQGQADVRYRITKLPRYLILHIVRFTSSSFSVQKNRTIVTFPVKNLELKECIPSLACRSAKYDLIANVVHDGKKPNEGSYRALVKCKPKGTWYEIQELCVWDKQPELVSEAYIQFYEQQKH